MKRVYFGLAAIAIAAPLIVYAAGGKMRLSEVRTDIEEGYSLCLQEGVTGMTLSYSDGLSVDISCPIPEWEW